MFFTLFFPTKIYRYRIHVELKDSSGRMHTTLKDKHAEFIFRGSAAYLKELQLKVFNIMLYFHTK